MKRIYLFLGAVLLSAAALLTSCSSDNNNPVDLPPTLSFVTGGDFISHDDTVAINTSFQVKILAEANTTSGSKIESVKLTRVFNLQSNDTTYSGYNDATLSIVITFPGMPVTGTENIEFKVTDKDGQSATLNLVITWVEAAGGPIDIFEMKVLGSYQSSTGSSFASINGNVYSQEEAFNNQALIDFLYWWGGSTNATLGAPDDANANLVFTGTWGLPNWTTAKNPTRFRTTTVTVGSFDAMTDDTDIIAIATGSDQTRIGELVVDQVIAFVTSTGKHGLIKVGNIITGASGSITINVKVEK